MRELRLNSHGYSDENWSSCSFPSPPLGCFSLCCSPAPYHTWSLLTLPGITVMWQRRTGVAYVGLYCPFLPCDWEGTETCLQDSAYPSVCLWRNAAPMGLGRLIGQAGLQSGLRPTLMPLFMRLPSSSFHLQSLPFLPSNRGVGHDCDRGYD